MSNYTSDDEVKSIEESSYVKLGQLNKDSCIVNSSISAVISAIREDIASKLDESIAQQLSSSLSTQIGNGFQFEYDDINNCICAVVAGNTKSFSANDFTEARMLSSVNIEHDASDSPWLVLNFKVGESSIKPISIDLMQIMPMYVGDDGIDIQYSDGKWHVSADSELCRRSDISSISAQSDIPSGHILTSLSQSSGIINYGTEQLMSSDVSCLEEFVSSSIDSSQKDIRDFVSTLSGNDGLISALCNEISAVDQSVANKIDNRINSLSCLDPQPAFIEDGSIKVLTSLAQQNGHISAATKVLLYSEISGLTGKLDSIDAAIDGRLPLSGGVLTGDLSIDNARLALVNGSRFINDGSDVEIYNANYLQTTVGDDGALCVFNYSGKNSFLQAEMAWSGDGSRNYGIACTGSRGFYVLKVNIVDGYVKLSGTSEDAQSFQQFVTEYPNEAYSIALGEYYAVSCLQLSAIEVDPTETSAFYAKIKLLDLNSGIKDLSSQTEQKNIESVEKDDENGFYCPWHTEIGNTVIHNFYGNHAEGGSTKAIGKYAHAEGRRSIADCRYSHVEGDNNYAAGYASHAEGNNTVAYGHSSHSEGQQTWAIGAASHAAGIKAYANDKYSFAWSGISSTPYPSNGVGTFNINPIGGSNGFFIGTSSLADYITDAQPTVPSDLSSFTNSPGYLTKTSADLDFQPKGEYLMPNDVAMSYDDQTIWLSSKDYVTSVNCSAFIKDGMLSTVELCGTTLVLSFNTDAGSAPISVELSDFADNYDNKITYLSNRIDNLSNDFQPKGDYLTSVPVEYKTYAETLVTLSNDGYVVSTQLTECLTDIDGKINAINSQISGINSKFQDISTDANISSFVDQIENIGLDNIQVGTIVSALYSLVKALGYST